MKIKHSWVRSTIFFQPFWNDILWGPVKKGRLSWDVCKIV